MATEEKTGEEAQIPPRGTIDLNREALLTLLSEIVQKEHKKILHGRVRDEKNFKLRLDSVRTFAYLANVYASVLKDKDLSEILKRLEVLENASK